MLAEITPLVQAILHTLLDRLEQPGRQQVVRVRLLRRDHPEYFDAVTSAPRLSANQELAQLAQAGAVKLRWRKWETNNWLDAVDLVPAQAATLYTLLARTPRPAQTASLAELLTFEAARAPWHTAFLDWARAQLAVQRTVAPLNSRRSSLEPRPAAGARRAGCAPRAGPGADAEHTAVW